MYGTLRGAVGRERAPRSDISEQQPNIGSSRRTATDQHLSESEIPFDSGVHDHFDGILAAVGGHPERFGRLIETEAVGHQGVG